jgi:protein-disulfide isomerase
VREIEQTEIANGTVRLVWRHFPVLGEESIWAAEAIECAGDQGRFWEYKERLLAEDPGRGRQRFSREALKGYAVDLGLDGASFNGCFDGRRYQGRVDQEAAEGRRKGVTSTPTFFVGAQRVVGIPEVRALRQLIQDQARRKGA